MSINNSDSSYMLTSKCLRKPGYQIIKYV